MRHVILAAALAATATAAGAAPFTLRLIGTQEIATGTRFEGVEFGGLSGLDRAADDRFYAMADDRGGDRGTPRFYTLSLDYDATGFHGVTVNSQTFMQRPDGSTFPATTRTVDPEAVRVAPDGNLYWSSEGNFSTDPAKLFQPFVREMTADGGFVREFDMPAQYDYVDGTTTGARNNKLFEALAVTPSGSLFVASEDALVQDGPPTTLAAGSVVRVTKLDPTTGRPVAQYGYALPPIPTASSPAGLFADNGLVELLALDDDSFIAVERAFAVGVGNTIRLALTEIGAGTTDISGIDSLIGASYEPMSREVILDMPVTFEGVLLDNIEALAWGKTLANGNRTLVLASDNNFSAAQRTLFMAFEVQDAAVAPVPLPGAVWLMLGGVGALAALRRRAQA